MTGVMRLALGVCLVAAAAAPASADGNAATVSHGGLDRVVWTVDGRADKSAPAPLVLALHGYRKPDEAEALRGTPARLGWSRLAAVARREGFVAVIPAAYRGQWNVVPGLKNTQRDDGTPIDDVGFLLGLVADLVANGTDRNAAKSPVSRLSNR